ncbi:hypothetical protein SASPL_124758 [Salvia splendens]|uniref:F-box domain-containing protein n=1 Tax=Salvia splendens TaxID=180675 RepID=A0A8X8ZP81_SALSN|nr:hypothetical protein SASPL_124758 [Salvia splendens]
MGASLSNLGENGSGSGGPGLGDIPESCVACVFLYLSPPEICNLARLNRSFRGAASSDAVWEAKLPSNYHHLLQLLSNPVVCESLSKKDIFAFLARPNPLDDGNKARPRFVFSTAVIIEIWRIRLLVWVDRNSGRVCMSISAKGMAITGIDDRRYWNWVPTEESRSFGSHWIRVLTYMVILDPDLVLLLVQIWAPHVYTSFFVCRFSVVAYLQQIWWFEVDGSVTFPFPPDIYTLSFRIHLGRFSRRLGRRISHFDHTHGWDIKPVRFQLSTSGGQHASSECFLDVTPVADANGSYKRGCWIEYKVGEFLVNESDPPTEVRFSMKQIDCTHSKGGLCVDSVLIMPSEKRRGGSLK